MFLYSDSTSAQNDEGEPSAHTPLRQGEEGDEGDKGAKPLAVADTTIKQAAVSCEFEGEFEGGEGGEGSREAPKEVGQGDEVYEGNKKRAAPSEPSTPSPLRQGKEGDEGDKGAKPVTDKKTPEEIVRIFGAARKAAPNDVFFKPVIDEQVWQKKFEDFQKEKRKRVESAPRPAKRKKN